MSAAPTPGSALCWNCRQPLQVGAERCLWCGVPQQAAPTQYVVAPGAASVTEPTASTSNSLPQAVPPSASVTPRTVSAPAARIARGQVALAPRFAGSVASVGAQLTAFTVDVVVLFAVGAVALLLTKSILLAALAFVELAAIFWVLLARAGVTPGNALLRLRLARDDVPYSPGTARALLRSVITTIAFLIAAVGAWILLATGAGDPRARSWADRAARTQVVAIPQRSRSVPPRVVPATQLAAGVQVGYGTAEPPLVLAAPQVVSTATRMPALDENSVSQSHTGALATAAPIRAPQAEAPAAVAQPPAVADGLEGTLLLVFDSGQREQLPTPVALNMGRSPERTEPSDKLIVVREHEGTVSKTHLRLEHSRGRTWVTDFGSTNGTDLLDDEGDVIPLTPNNRVLLDEGTRVRVGNRVFTVSLLVGGEK